MLKMLSMIQLSLLHIHIMESELYHISTHGSHLLQKSAHEQHQQAENKSFRSLDALVTPDGFLSIEKLKNHIEHQHWERAHSRCAMQLKDIDLDMDGGVTWSELQETTHGFIEDEGDLEGDFREIEVRDSRRFETADVDGDGSLRGEELVAFLSPHLYEHMEEIRHHEAFGDIDVDQDGSISVDEYLEHVQPYHDNTHHSNSVDSWMRKERKLFAEVWDVNGDNMLSVAEAKRWLSSEGSEVEVEARGLMDGCDVNGDGVVSRVEMIQTMNRKSPAFTSGLDFRQEL